MDASSWRAQYLVDAYDTASGTWNDFLKHQDREALQYTAHTLCGAHRDLEHDDVFWSRFHQLVPKLEEKREAIKQYLTEFDEFLAAERRILRELELKDTIAERLIGDVNQALRDVTRARALVQENPTNLAIENLRADSQRLQAAVCAVDTDLSAIGLFTGARAVGRSMEFIVGGALTALNASIIIGGTVAGTPETYVPALTSVNTGYLTMSKHLMECGFPQQSSRPWWRRFFPYRSNR